MGGSLYNFVTGDKVVNPSLNPECPAGGFSVWNGLQGAEDFGKAIIASDIEMAELDGQNAMAYQII